MREGHGVTWAVWDGCINNQRLPDYIQNGGHGGLFEVGRNVLLQFYRHFAAWFYLYKIYFFVQIYLVFISRISFFTYFLNYSATLRLFLRSLRPCLLTDLERSSVSRSFICNRTLLLERRDARCVWNICFWLEICF